MRRAATYSQEDWVRIKAEGDGLDGRLAAALASGVGATSTAAMDLAEEHRQHMGRWFYECPPQMHRHIAAMYVDDPRFRARYEAIAPGLAEFVRDAAEANADRSAL